MFERRVHGHTNGNLIPPGNLHKRGSLRKNLPDKEWESDQDQKDAARMCMSEQSIVPPVLVSVLRFVFPPKTQHRPLNVGNLKKTEVFEEDRSTTKFPSSAPPGRQRYRQTTKIRIFGLICL